MALLGSRSSTIRLLIAAMVCRYGAYAADPVVNEYEVKAIFLFNFAQFVEWPAQAFQSAGEPIGICIFGENPFDSALTGIVRGKTVGGRRLAVREVSQVAEASACHILFFPESETKRAAAVLRDVRKLSVLTVGETEDFLPAGGIIRLKLVNERIRFEVNAGAASGVNLRISSKLLSLAEGGRR